MSRMLLRASLALVLLAAGGCSKSDKKSPAAEALVNKPVVAVLEMPQGTIEIELLSADAPKTVENFRLLAGRGYYNGLTFHRVVRAS